MPNTSIHNMHREVLEHEDSPSFLAPFPTVINEDLIPHDVRTAMMAGWGTTKFPQKPINIVTLFDVYVTGEGLVFDHEKNVIAESITQYTEPALSEAKARVLSATDVPTEWGKSILLRKRGDSNYGHWFVELLPKLWVAGESTMLDCCVIPKRLGAMKAVMETALKMTAPECRVIEHADNDVLFFKQLVFVDGLTQHGVYMSPLVFSKTDKLAPAKTPTRRLFVSRRGAPRNLANEDAVIAALEAVGFDVIHPGEMTLEEQIDAFSTASHVVGVMGAGMTNIMFCSPGAKVVNLAPAEFPDTFFYFIATHRKLDYTEIRGPNVDAVKGWDSLFRVSASQILTALGMKENG